VCLPENPRRRRQRNGRRGGHREIRRGEIIAAAIDVSPMRIEKLSLKKIEERGRDDRGN